MNKTRKQYPITDDLIATIKQLRAANISQKKVAHILNISNATTYSIEKGGFTLEGYKKVRDSYHKIKLPATPPHSAKGRTSGYTLQRDTQGTEPNCQLAHGY